MKQCIQLLLVSKFRKFHEYIFICISIMLVTNTDLVNRKLNPEFKGFNASSQKWSRLFLMSKQTDPANLMKIYSAIYRNVTHRHGTVSRYETAKQSIQALNGLDNCFLCCPWHIMEISWTFVHAFPNILLTNTDPENTKIDPVFKRLTARCLEFSRVFGASCPNFP